MNYQMKAEAADQVYAKFTKRPTLKGLDRRLLGEGPAPHDVIEVTGDASAGKSMLMLQWICCAILDSSHGGQGAGVVLIDTDHHQPISILVRLMEAQMKSHNSSKVPHRRLTSAATESAIMDALKRLIILSVYDSTQLRTALITLDKVFPTNPLVSMVVIDSLSAFYWADRLCGGPKHMDSYLHQLLSIAQKSTQKHNVTTVFSRPSHFQSGTSRFKAKDGFQGSTVFITLTVLEVPKRTDENEQRTNQDKKVTYSALVRSGSGQNSYKYRTSREGFVWI